MRRPLGIRPSSLEAILTMSVTFSCRPRSGRHTHAVPAAGTACAQEACYNTIRRLALPMVSEESRGRTDRRLTFSCVLLVAAISLASTGVFACDCGELNPPLVELEQSDAVFTGLVLSVTPTSAPDIVSVLTYVTGYWKGVPTSTVQVFTDADEAACGYPFSEGSEYLVYSIKYSYPCCDGLTTGLCWRTRPVAAAQEDFDALGPPATVPVTPASWGMVKTLYR
jgi:hypothetical protein